MAVTATLKFVLRGIPASHEHDGLVYLALHNVPKGVPARVHLDEAPLSVGCPASCGARPSSAPRRLPRTGRHCGS